MVNTATLAAISVAPSLSVFLVRSSNCFTLFTDGRYKIKCYVTIMNQLHVQTFFN